MSRLLRLAPVLFLLLCGPVLAEKPELDPDIALEPAHVIEHPWPKHIAPTKRQGVPGIERTADGRLWAVWVRDAESSRSYVVLASSDNDGSSWSDPHIMVLPRQGVRAMSSSIWIDPRGRLWLFWGQSFGGQDGRYGVWTITCENPDADTQDLSWTEPRRIGDGILMNKPTVLSNGDWLLCSSIWKADNSALVLASTNEGKTFELRGAANIENPSHRGPDEHMIVERKDGSLWMMVRCRGIAGSFSSDGGRTWTPITPTQIPHPTSRFFLRRLQSGALLLVKNGPMDERTKRERLMAFISDDDGQTWQGGLIIDEREDVTYPDGVQAEDGSIYIVYDHERTPNGIVLLAKFTEADVRAGEPVSDQIRLKTEVTRVPTE